MTQIIPNQFTAQIEGDFVLFILGMRINKPWKIWQWWPIFSTMPRLIRELERAGPDSGFLGHTPLRPILMVQYWRSFEHLERYARARDRQHWPAWVAFNKRIKDRRGDVGIWHETYQVRAGDYEAIYTGMPPFGLSGAQGVERLVFAPGLAGRSTARDRLSGHRLPGGGPGGGVE
jgi:hypothetical protein